MPRHPGTGFAVLRLCEQAADTPLVLIAFVWALSGLASGAAAAAAFVSFELTYPAGHGLDSATVGASGHLSVGPGDRILASDGAPGTITNTGLDGADVTEIGSRAAVGDIVSVPGIVAGPNATATGATTSGTVRAGPNADLGPIVEQTALTPFVRRPIIAHTSGGAPSDVIVGPGVVRALLPGEYGNVSIGPNATVSMTAGTYIVEQFSLGPNARLDLDTANGTIDIYARASATWKGSTSGDATRFVFGYLGAGELSLAAGFRGTVLVPAGTLRLGPGGSRDVFEGTFYGRHVVVGPNVAVRKLPIPPFGADVEGCAARVPVRDGLPQRERDIAYQEDIARLCSAAGVTSCRARLIGRANADYTAAAAQLLTGRLSPAAYLAVVRDRTRKLHAAEDDVVLATSLCTALDSDGDGVPDARDLCPGTPDLTATDDSGCPLATLPPAPSAEDVAKVFSTLHLAVNPKCLEAPVPTRIPAGAFYWPAFRERGTYILAGEVQNQPAGCPVWYEFDIQEISGPRAGEAYAVVFMDREASTNLVELGRPVPLGYIQFNPRPGQVGGRDRLATTGGVAGIRYRVRAMNGNGVRGLWSDYKISDRASCTALGFECGE
jgi:hypothetical protein